MEQQKRKSYWVDYGQSTKTFVFIKNFCDQNEITTGFEGPHLWITGTDESVSNLFEAVLSWDITSLVQFFDCKPKLQNA